MGSMRLGTHKSALIQLLVLILQVIPINVGVQYDMICRSLKVEAFKAINLFAPKRVTIAVYAFTMLSLVIPKLRTLVFDLLDYPLLYLKFINAFKIGYMMYSARKAKSPQKS